MDLSDAAFFALLAREPVARLATVDASGRPHVVPVVFTPSAGLLYTPIDGKPKRSGTLKRLRNVAANPAACLLIDHYEADWQRLWWLRVDVHADVVGVDDRDFEPAVAALRLKYPQYATTPILRGDQVLIRMRVLKRAAWSASTGTFSTDPGALLAKTQRSTPMASPAPGSAEWLALVEEPIIDPDQRIVDPHHHLWPQGRFGAYLLDDLWSDTQSGHRVEKTVFVECGASYRDAGPEELKPIGETEFVATIAAQSSKGQAKARIAGIVGRADLTLGASVETVLEAHKDAGRGLFRGIRHAGARDPHPEALSIPGRAPEGLYAMPAFRTGVRTLGKLGLTYDTWHYHHQNAAFAELARAVPETTMILDHFGTPLGVGPYADKREEIFTAWKRDIAAIAKYPNVVAKLGGLAMPDNGFGWDTRAKPATSDELVDAQRRYYLHTIECFGPERCMFESNFPVDKRSLSYRVLYNALKKIASGFTAAEKHAMFYGTAERVYRL